MNILDLQRKAESANGVAQRALGIAYLDGIDVAGDYQEAFRLRSATAAQGRSRAYLAWLGCMRRDWVFRLISKKQFAFTRRLAELNSSRQLSWVAYIRAV